MTPQPNTPPTELNAPYLEYEPPSWGTRGLAYLLILVFCAAAVASVVIHIPETVSCPFVLAPVGGTDPVRASHDGHVDVHVRDGQTVGAGETLFVLRSDVIGDRSSELAVLLVQREGARQSLTNAEEKHVSRDQADVQAMRTLELRAQALGRKLKATERIQAIQKVLHDASCRMLEQEIDSLKLEVDVRKKIRDSGQEIATRSAQLTQTKALGEMENIRIRQELDRNRVDLEQGTRALSTTRQKLEQLKREQEGRVEEWQLTLDELRAELEGNASALAKLKHERAAAATEHAELKRTLNETIAKAAIRIAALEKELQNRKGNEISVVAPAAGTVLRLQVKETGTFVRSGDVLCELAAGGATLEAELSIPSARIGRVTSAQRVKLLYDAFPYERFGIHYGSVRWVSPASVAAGELDGLAGQRIFRVLATADDASVRVDGEERPLRAGMGGRAEVVVGRRSLLSFAFAPLKQLQENLSEPDAGP